MRARLLLVFAAIASLVATAVAPAANAGTLTGPSTAAIVTCNSAGQQLLIAPHAGAGTAFASQRIAFKIYYFWRAKRSDPWGTAKLLLVDGSEWTSYIHNREQTYWDGNTLSNQLFISEYPASPPQVTFGSANRGQYRVLIAYAWQQLSGSWLYSPSYLETTQYFWNYSQGTYSECWI
jgi:hypothetical protein